VLNAVIGTAFFDLKNLTLPNNAPVIIYVTDVDAFSATLRHTK
jgi:hypothetical protein